MKILHIIPSVSPVRGGTSTAILGEVKALRKWGIDAEILTTLDDGDNLLDFPTGQFIEYQQVPVCFLSKFSPKNFALREFIYSGDFAPFLWQNIHQYDLIEIHSLFSYVCTAAGIICRMKKKPYIINPHGHFLPWVINQKRLKKEIYNFLLEKANLNHANRIRCTSSGEVKDVADFGIKTPTVNVPLGIETIKELDNAKEKLHQLYKIEKQTAIILFFSRLHPKKRPDLLLEVMAEIHKNGGDFHLILAGNGDSEYIESLQKLTEDLGIKSKTTFTGLITENKELYLRGSDLFVLPSFGENFALVVAEAMSVGLPVITTPEVQISSDIVAAKAGLIVEGEKTLWVKAITELLTDKEQRQKLGENAQKLAGEKYIWDQVAKSLISVYNEVIIPF
jgi:glycosyltransferase involved in cell wall biosynthesis